jgi:hypothetical protein
MLREPIAIGLTVSLLVLAVGCAGGTIHRFDAARENKRTIEAR